MKLRIIPFILMLLLVAPTASAVPVPVDTCTLAQDICDDINDIANWWNDIANALEEVGYDDIGDLDVSAIVDDISLVYEATDIIAEAAYDSDDEELSAYGEWLMDMMDELDDVEYEDAAEYLVDVIDDLVDTLDWIVDWCDEN